MADELNIVDDLLSEEPIVPDAAPSSGDAPSDSPATAEGDISDDLIAEIEAEAAQQMGAPKPKPGEKTAEPTPVPTPSTDSDDPLEQIIQDQFGGDRAKAAAHFRAFPGELAAIKAQIQALVSPVDTEAAERALEQEIRNDSQVVDYNREIETIDADIKRMQAENTRSLQAMGTLQEATDILKGRAEEAAEDRKESLKAQAAAKQSEIAALNSSYISNLRTIKESEREKKTYERRLHERVNDIRADVSDRANQAAKDRTSAVVLHNAFNNGVKGVAGDLKIKFSDTDVEFIKGMVIRVMNKDTSDRDWPASRVKDVAMRAAQKYAQANGRTVGSRAAALAPRAPSAPRPASVRVATPKAPDTGVTAEMQKDPAFWRKRAQIMESKGVGVGASRGRR